jgi:Tannase and feruloyl esterase
MLVKGGTSGSLNPWYWISLPPWARNRFRSGSIELSTEAKVGLERTQDFYRLFMAPGMNHCKGGPGANVFDMLTPLVHWVEQGMAPDRILATHYADNSPHQGVAFTRPLCSYPLKATYKGSGSTNDAANFACE